MSFLDDADDNKSVDEFQAILNSMDVLSGAVEKMDSSGFGKHQEGFEEIRAQIESVSQKCREYAKILPKTEVAEKVSNLNG